MRGLRAADGLLAFERALGRRGLSPVAGADEAGRGACAGPLVAAACVLPEGRRARVPGLADSKLLAPAVREEVYAEIVQRAVAYSIVVVPAAEVDRRGLHVSNVAALRRAVSVLLPRTGYALTDGFAVPGLPCPSLAVWKGDQVAGCVAAASVLAKVSRDRLLVDLDTQWPGYGFAQHKGYATAAHSEALHRLGPCPEHRFSYLNVRRVGGLARMRDTEDMARDAAVPA